MKPILILLITSMFTCVAALGDQKAIDHCKKHLLSVLSFDLKTLESSYGENIQLMAGHEFLKANHAIGNRKLGATVTRQELLAAMKKDIGDRKPRPKKKIEAKLMAVKYIKVGDKEGKIILDPSDPVGTPDGKLHFNLQKGDLVYKVQPPRGDFILLHVRKKDNAWLVVSEYLD